MKFPAFFSREQTMRRRLLGYMLVLLALVLGVLLAGLSLMGRFRSDQSDLEDALTLQLDFWEKDLLRSSDALAAMGIDLSEALSQKLDTTLEALHLSPEQLRRSPAGQTALMDALLPSLRDALLRADASGAYLLLDLPADPAAATRPGLYLQRKVLAPSDDSLLLYRGISGVGKDHGIMPHRKWRLELSTAPFADPGGEIPYDAFPEDWSYRYTPIFTLPGTSEQAVLLQVPLRTRDGTLRGLCGFEISQTYFKEHRTQPALYPRLCFLLASPEVPNTLSQQHLAAGTVSNYFIHPSGPLEIRPASRSLLAFRSPQQDFVGLSRSLSLNPDSDPYLIAVILPQGEYTHILWKSLTQSLLLTALVTLFAVGCCIFFSKTYLLPILRGLEELRVRKPAADSGVQEIDDLFRFLLSQDQAHADALRALEDEKNTAQNRAALIQREYEAVRRDCETSRLKIDRLQQVEPDSAEFEVFRLGLTELTVTERKIVQYYFEGKTVKEIQALMDIKETTLRYHNRNIYGKLGVHSMKQLLRFAVYADALAHRD